MTTDHSYTIAIVIGARSLSAAYGIKHGIRKPDEAHRVERRAKAWLWDQMGTLVGGDGRNTVFDGGAEGPDTWGYENALAYDLVWTRYHADGRYEGGRGRGGSTAPRSTWRPIVRPATNWPHFRERNDKVLSDATLLQKRDGARAWVLALLDVASPTGGAAWTCGNAVDRGLEVSIWPG